MGTKWGTSREERFFAKVDKTRTCWIWVAATTYNGYGMFGVGETTTTAHRVSYEMHVGPIPEGFQVDHLCHVRVCVNPAHLEAVTPGENIQRRLPRRVRTHCPHGHLWDDENTIIDGRGTRICRICKNARNRAAYQAKKVSA